MGQELNRKYIYSLLKRDARLRSEKIPYVLRLITWGFSSGIFGGCGSLLQAQMFWENIANDNHYSKTIPLSKP